MQAMLGAPLFAAEHQQTRDQTLHGIELLARRYHRDEVEVAQKLLELMRAHNPPQTSTSADGDNTATSGADYWLRGRGRPSPDGGDGGGCPGSAGGAGPGLERSRGREHGGTGGGRRPRGQRRRVHRVLPSVVVRVRAIVSDRP